MLYKVLSKVQRFRGEVPRNAAGIEVESESALGVIDADAIEIAQTGGWSAHMDGSLVNGIELTTPPVDLLSNTTPKLAKDLEKSLAEFFKKAKIHFSERASTHVHFNCRDRTVIQILSILCGYYVVENILLRLCDESRRSNHFCLALSDSMTMIDNVVRRINNGEFPFGDNAYKYAGLNLGRLRDFGTVEVRIMGSLTSSSAVFQWARDVSNILSGFAETYSNPSELLNAYAESPENFLRFHLPKEILEVVSNETALPVSSFSSLCSSNIPMLLPLAQIKWDEAEEVYLKRSKSRKVWQLDGGFGAVPPEFLDADPEAEAQPLDDEDEEVVRIFRDGVAPVPPGVARPFGNPMAFDARAWMLDPDGVLRRGL